MNGVGQRFNQTECRAALLSSHKLILDFNRINLTESDLFRKYRVETSAGTLGVLARLSEMFLNISRQILERPGVGHDQFLRILISSPHRGLYRAWHIKPSNKERIFTDYIGRKGGDSLNTTFEEVVVNIPQQGPVHWDVGSTWQSPPH